jgi:uncharacterized protein
MATDFRAVADDRFDYGEPRYISAGHLRGRMVVIVWTPRIAAKLAQAA